MATRAHKIIFFASMTALILPTTSFAELRRKPIAPPTQQFADPGKISVYSGPRPKQVLVTPNNNSKAPGALGFGNAVAGIVNRLTGNGNGNTPKDDGSKAVGFGYDENMKKEPGIAPAPPNEKGGAGNRVAPMPLPYYLPFCFFVDPNFPEATVNAAIKTMVDSYATCGIAIDVWATTIQPNYPADPAGLQAVARQQCDFGSSFGTRGSIMVMSRFAGQPAAMCQEQGATGCSTLCERLSVQILAPGTGAGTALHESLHGNCCGRICVNQGEGSVEIGAGISMVSRTKKGKIKPFWAEEGTGNYDAQLNQQVCPSLQSGSARNNGSRLWDPSKTRYYARAADPARQWNLTGGQTFIRPPLPPREPTDPPNGDRPSNPDVSQDKGPPGKSKLLIDESEVAGYAHRNKHPIAGGAQTLLSAVRSGPANFPPAMNAGAQGGGRPILKSYGYDEGARKEAASSSAGAGAFGGGNGGSSGGSGSPPAAGGSGFGYDEGASKDLASSPPSAKGGGSYGYDEGGSKEAGVAGGLPLGGSGGNAGGALKNQLGFAKDGGGLSESDMEAMKPGKSGYGKPRKRGESLTRTSDGKKKSMGIPRQSDALISRRPEPDFTVDAVPVQDVTIY